MPDKIKIIECPRDAMQGIKDFIPTEAKVKYIQALLGVNFYFTKKVRLRLNADLRLTKSEYDESGKYATNESRGIVEVHVRF